MYVCRLYTVDGVRVHNTGDLICNGQYVAVGQYGGFQRLNYGATKPAFSLTASYRPRYIQSVSQLV